MATAGKGVTFFGNSPGSRKPLPREVHTFNTNAPIDASVPGPVAVATDAQPPAVPSNQTRINTTKKNTFEKMLLRTKAYSSFFNREKRTPTSEELKTEMRSIKRSSDVGRERVEAVRRLKEASPPTAGIVAAEPPGAATKELTLGERRLQEAKELKATAEAAPEDEEVVGAVVDSSANTAEETAEETAAKELTLGEKRLQEAMGLKAATVVEGTSAPVVPEAAPKKTTLGERRAEAAKLLKETVVATGNKNTRKNKKNNKNTQSSTLASVAADIDEVEDIEEGASEGPGEVVEEEKKVAGEIKENQRNADGENAIAKYGDPSLPSLLRIGDDGTSEYISLADSPIPSRNNYNTLYTGNAKVELQKKYNVKTKEQIVAMQRAFGVKRMFNKAPLLGYIERDCKFPGFDLVINALNMRIETLKEKIKLATDSSLSIAREKYKITWLTDTVEKMRKITKDCPVEVVVQPLQKVTKGDEVKEGCPCLEEVNLLRDLVYVVLLLQGNAHPQIKKQLEGIPLQQLLNTALEKDSTKYKTHLQDALKILKDLLQKKVQNTNVPSERNILEELYRFLKKENAAAPIPADLSVEMIKNIIEGKLKELEGKVAEINKFRALEQEYTQKEEELEKVKVELAALKASMASSDTEKAAELEKVKGAFETLQGELAQLKEEKVKVEGELEGCKTRETDLQLQLDMAKNVIQANKNARRSEVTEVAETGVGTDVMDIAENKSLQTEPDANLERLREQLEGVQRERDTLQTRVNEMNDIIQQVERKLQETIEELEQLKVGHNSLITEKEAQITSLTAELESSRGEVARLQQQLVGAEGEKGGVLSQLEEANKKIQDIEKKLQETIVELEQLKGVHNSTKSSLANKEAEVVSLAAQIQTLTAELDVMRVEKDTMKESTDLLIQDLRKELEAKDDEIERLKSRISALEEESLAKNAEITGLKQSRARNLESFEKSKAELEEQRNKATEEIGALQNARDEEKRNLSSQLASAKAALEELRNKSEKDLATSSKEITDLTTNLAAAQAHVTELEEKLRALGAEGDAALQSASAKQAEIEAQIEGLKTSYNAELQASREKCETDIATIRAELEAAKIQAARNVEKVKEESEIALQQLKQEKDKNKSSDATRIAELQSRLDEKEAELNKLVAQLEEKESKLSHISGEKDTLQGQLANVSSSRTSNIQKLQGELAEQSGLIEAKERNIQILQGQLAEQTSLRESLEGQLANVSSSRTSNIQRLQGELTEQIALRESLEGQLTDVAYNRDRDIKALKEQYEGELSELHTVLQKKPTDEQLQKQLAYIKSLQGRVEELETNLSAVETARDFTEKRLQTLLVALTTDEEMLNKAKMFLQGEPSVKLENITADFCNVFVYLYDVVHIQDKMLHNVRGFSNLKANIFSIFDKQDTTVAMPDDTALLKELSVVFQTYFVSMNDASADMEEIIVQPSATLSALFDRLIPDGTTQPVKKGSVSTEIIRKELGVHFHFLNSIGIIPQEDSTFLFKGSNNTYNDFVEKNEGRFIPLSILAIKFIQLLRDIMGKKYTTFASRCGLKFKPSEEDSVEEDEENEEVRRGAEQILKAAAAPVPATTIERKMIDVIPDPKIYYREGLFDDMAQFQIYKIIINDIKMATTNLVKVAVANKYLKILNELRNKDSYRPSKKKEIDSIITQLRPTFEDINRRQLILHSPYLVRI